MLGDRLPIRVGVNTGEVVASANADAGGDFLLTGDAVNVAARLVQQGRSPGGWWPASGLPGAGGRVRLRRDRGGRGQGQGRCRFRPPKVLGGRTASRAAPAPIVGRDADLAQLRARRAARVRRAPAYLVDVVAPAGVGKTRLLEAFVDAPRATDGRMSLVATAQCLPYGQRLTFWPLRAILFDVRAARTRRPTKRCVQGSPSGSPTPATSTPTTAELLAGDDRRGRSREPTIGSRCFAAWRDTFVELAAERRWSLVIEDLHWSSDSLLDLVEYDHSSRAATCRSL